MSQYRFLLKDVEITQCSIFPKVDPLLYSAYHLEANDRQFFLSVPDIADFYAEDGVRIFIRPAKPFRQETIEPYLHGSLLGALFHQRGILTLHGSSCQWNDRAMIICGDSGFGKSSLTLQMCLQHGAHFLTDDITPIRNGKIMPVSERLKLWQDTLDQLSIQSESLKSVWKGMDKFYLPMDGNSEAIQPDFIFFGELTYQASHFETIHGAEKFEYVLRSQYWEALANGMANSREKLFDSISDLCTKTRMIRFERCIHDSIEESAGKLLTYLSSL